MKSFNPETGKDLTVVIFSEPIPQGDWGGFALWYTCKKIWPDARYLFSLPKRPIGTHLLRWLDRCHVRRIRHADNTSIEDRLASLISSNFCSKPIIGLDYRLIGNRKFLDNELEILLQGKIIKDNFNKFVYIGNGIKDEIISSVTGPLDVGPIFYSIDEKIGKFNCKNWCEKTHAAPFGAAWDTTNKNEKRIMELWGGMYNYHSMVSR